MGTSLKNPGYIPAMIFGILFTALVVVFICRCKYRSRKNNKINNMMLRNMQQKTEPLVPEPGAGVGDKQKYSMNNTATGLPEVDNDHVSVPVVQSPQVLQHGRKDKENTDFSIVLDKEKSNSGSDANNNNNNCNGAQSHV